MAWTAARAILHVDMDAFYASVEQHDDPTLQGKPIIVGGAGGRGVVAAASYEVRRFGVRSAMPVRRALALCPDAICIRPRMARYSEVSRQVFEVFNEFTPLVQGLSLDEAYLDVTHSQRLLGDAVEIARHIKQRIRERTGLGASVGVAPNRLVAKIASDLEKPDGLVVVPPERVHAVLDPLPVKRLPGLGRKKGEQVAAAGIATLGELRRASDSVLWPLFGRDSARMRERAAGIDERPVTSDWEERSVSAEETFASDVGEVSRLQAALAQLTDRTASRLRSKHLVAGCVDIKIRRHDFETFSRQQHLEPPTHDTLTLTRIASQLLATWLQQNPGARLRLLGVGVSDLAPAAQLDLFQPDAQPEATRLDATVDRIRARFGKTAVTRGARERRGRSDGPTKD